MVSLSHFTTWIPTFYFKPTGCKFFIERFSKFRPVGVFISTFASLSLRNAVKHPQDFHRYKIVTMAVCSLYVSVCAPCMRNKISVVCESENGGNRTEEVRVSWYMLYMAKGRSHPDVCDSLTRAFWRYCDIRERIMSRNCATEVSSHTPGWRIKL